MADGRRQISEETLERMFGNLLRTGVLLAATVVLVGGIPYLARYGSRPPVYKIFHGEPADLRSVPGIVKDALVLSRRGTIQFGLLLLIATPVARVVLSVLAFAWQRDFTYVVVTLIVLAVLLYSLTGAYLSGGG